MNTIFDQYLNRVLTEEFDVAIKSAVGIVQDHDRWLLGLSTTKDDRKNKWVFPGGHLKRGEDPGRAAAREVKEETGVRCRAHGEAIILPDRKEVAFYHCKVTSVDQQLDPNSEFSAVGFFTTREMQSLKLYDNVKKLIDRVKRRC
jgi:8-oxo-dGTP pyrophosphatase MutT (NUDIX family)